MIAASAPLRGAAQDSDPQQQAEPQQPPDPDSNQPANAPTAPPVPRVAVRGIVKNSATGEPLPRALVRIEGEAIAGALTDGEGRFEINRVPVGMQIMGISKPGFHDDIHVGGSAEVALANGTVNFSMHNVRVSGDMPELEFRMVPTNAIRGQIDLSTGDPGQGIGLTLLRRTVQDGRAVWQMMTSTRTNSDGAFRFAGLSDGDYILYSEPSMDSEFPVALVDARTGQQVSRPGYSTVFYPDARDVAGAGRIHLAGGQTQQANLLLPEEPFYLVKASVTLPGAAPSAGSGRAALPAEVEILDAQGHHLPYSGQFDWKTHTAQAFLPDGTYSLLITVMPIPGPVSMRAFTTVGTEARVVRDRDSAPTQFIGEATFSVAGRAVTHLTVPLARQQGGSIQVSLARSNAPPSTQHNQSAPIVVMVSQAGGLISDGMVSALGEGYDTGAIETTFMNPGLYWVHTNIPQLQYCEASFTAGGASLAREPLALSLSGATAPLTLTLRDDCATLKISLPAASLDMTSTVVEPFYTVFVVPDFDSTADARPVTLRPTSGGTAMINGLTPGNYRVYTFAGPADLEYHNPEALAALPTPPQTVTLSPGATSELMVEVQGH